MHLEDIMGSKISQTGVGVELTVTVHAYYIWGPGFYPQHPKKQSKAKQNKTSQMQKEKYCLLLLICGI
jgi:hypothetical protein